jgi:hypothetical protein
LTINAPAKAPIILVWGFRTKWGRVEADSCLFEICGPIARDS